MAELNLANIQKAQDIAKQTMLELNREITVGMSERDIIVLAQKKMVDKGSDEWWYHGLPGLVLLGKHSAVSVGSKDINHTDEYRVAGNDIITIDIAPTYHKGWGDYARTLFMENGRMCPLDQPEDPKHKEGLEAELHIHRYMVEHSDRVIAVYDGRETGGTAKTIRFTHRMKKELREIPVGEIVLPDHLKPKTK